MKKSAGILPFRIAGKVIDVFLVHPGGPFWKNKEEHAWSISKGEFTNDELPFEAARREFYEETGFRIQGEFIELEPVKLPGGKLVYVWAVETELNPKAIKSNTFLLEWPPRSGKTTEYPEVDRASWFPLEVAFRKIHKGQIPVLEQLSQKIPELLQ